MSEIPVEDGMRGRSFSADCGWAGWDIGLQDEEIRTIVRWVDGGDPYGDTADKPAAVV